MNVTGIALKVGKLPSLATPPENAAARSIRKFGLADGCEKEFIEIYLYETAAGRPTCRQYAELNYAPIAIGDALCRQRCNLVRAYLRLTEIGDLPIERETPRSADEVKFSW